MATLKNRTRLTYQGVYDLAVSTLKPNEETGLYNEDEVLARVEAIRRESFDAAAARRRDAKHIVDVLARTVDEPEDETGGRQLALFNHRYSFAPRRLIRCDGGLVENAKAPLKAKEAELERSKTNRQRAQLWEDRKDAEVKHFRAWREVQRDNGRNPKQITWGICATETGLVSGRAPRSQTREDH